ncbi:MAG: hypothetical protein WB820_17295, partial [Rhodoplanes sp.]
IMGLARAFAVNPSRLRRDPAGFGDDRSARPSKEDRHAMNADNRFALLHLMRGVKAVGNCPIGKHHEKSS